MTTTSDNVWDNFSTPNSGDYPDRQFKFDQVGVAIAGTITNIRRAEFDGSAVPELWLDTEEGETSVLCGQFNLMSQLLDLRPNVGDKIAIKFTHTRQAKKGQAKLFEVALKRSDGTEVSPGVVVADVKTAADLL